MEDIKIYGHLISGISDDNSSYSNGDNWIAEAHDIYDEGFKNLSEEIVEGSLPVERQDLINRYLYSKEVNSTANLTEALSQEILERKNNDASLSAIDDRLLSQVDDIQDKLNNYKLYSIVTSLPTSNIDKNKIYIIASEEGVENNIYTEYIYTENNTWEKLGEFKSDIDLDQYVTNDRIPKYIVSRGNEDKLPLSFVSDYEGIHLAVHRWDAKRGVLMDVKLSNIIPLATDYFPGLMSAYQNHRFSHMPNLIINNINSEVSFSERLSGKVIEINYTTKNLDTNVENSRAIYIPTVNSEHIGLMSIDDKTKLDNIDSSLEGISIDTNTRFITSYNSSIVTPSSYSIQFNTKSIENDAFSAGSYATLPLLFADSSHAGIINSTDKVKLDNINEDSLLPQLPSDFGYYFPISRISPNSADNSTDWYSFEEPSVYNRDDEGPLNSVNVELSVCKAGSDIPNVLWDISIPAVSSNGAGVMTVNDKIKLDNITNDSLLPNTDDVAEGISVLTVGKTNHAGSTQTSVEWSKLSVGRNAHEMNIRGGNASNNTIVTLPPATDNEAGLLPAYLYTTLNNKQGIISGLKISSDTNTTTSDYIVLTRADYQAILDRLTTLEQLVRESQNP